MNKMWAADTFPLVWLRWLGTYLHKSFGLNTTRIGEIQGLVCVTFSMMSESSASCSFLSTCVSTNP